MIKPIASRRTTDGHIVRLWPDGALTWALGSYIKGSPQPRSPEQVKRALKAGWLVMGEVELYSDSEVPALIAAARWAADRDGLPGTLRARLHRAPSLRPHWVTLQSDRDGRPVLQVWRLPRLRWPGLAVWREKGRYEVMREVGSSGTYVASGCAFSNLEALSSHLAEVSVSHGA